MQSIFILWIGIFKTVKSIFKKYKMRSENCRNVDVYWFFDDTQYAAKMEQTATNDDNN